MLINEEFIKIPAGIIFARGVFLNKGILNDMIPGAPVGVLKWIAKKGRGDDWCIYYGGILRSVKRISEHGNHLFTEKFIRFFVPCSILVFEKYRY